LIVNTKSLLFYAPIRNMLKTKEREHGVSHGLSEAGYDIRIKQDIQFYRKTDGTPFHSVNGNEDWGSFTLASATEEFQMPPGLVGVVHDKSTWARQGLSVFNTVIEPGWNGFLTLELVYHGQHPLRIPAGAGIAQVLFHEVLQSVSYQGKYQNQADEPVSSIFEKETT